MNKIGKILSALLLVCLVYIILSNQTTQLDKSWQTTKYDKEYIPSATICGNTYFDANGNGRKDKSDPMIMGSVYFLVGTEFHQYPTHYEHSGDGGYCFIVPEGKKFEISIVNSTEELNKIIDPHHQFRDSETFRFKLIDKNTNATISGPLNKSVVWEADGSSDIDILIIGN
jgi:hypothetical protein